MIPTPKERPDLYDDFDGTGREPGQPTGVKTPDYIQKLLDERQGGKKAEQGKDQGKP